MQKWRYSQKYIDAKRMLFYIALKWLEIAGVTVAAIVILFGLNVVQQKNKINNNLKAYPQGYYVEHISVNEKDLAVLNNFWADLCQLRTTQNYNKNSVYMHIDSENVSKRVLTFYVWGENGVDAQTALNDIYTKMSEDELYKKIATALGMQESDLVYIRELVGFDMGIAQQMKINIIGENEEQTKKIGDEIESYFEEKIKAIEASLGQLHFEKKEDYSFTERDTGIRDTQQNSYDFENNYSVLATTEKEALTASQKKYWNHFAKAYNKGQKIEMGDIIDVQISFDKKVDLKAAVLASIKKGIAALGMLIILGVFMFCLTPYIWSGKNVRDSFGIEVMGTVKLHDNTRRVKNKFNGWVWRVFDIFSKDKKKQIEFIINSKMARAKNNEIIAVSNSWTDMTIFDFDVKAYTPDEFIDEFGKENKDISKLNILLVEQIGKTTFRKLDETLSILSEFDDNILGYISVE